MSAPSASAAKEPFDFKRLLLGRATSNVEVEHQRLSNPVALAVFSSDAISSTAYATGEIILMLALAGSGGMHLTLPISIVIGLLLLVVVLSYRQTIAAYPHGGGAYSVARHNLGDIPGLIAGTSLLVDYILTVAVSVSAGIAAVTSAVPELFPYRVYLAIAAITILAVANLRGLRESGAIFSTLTYGFIITLGLAIIVGFFRLFTGGAESIAVPPVEHALWGTAMLTPFLIARAFASGCTAMTGVEAIANGVSVFREPTAKNAQKTMAMMAGILLFLFLGLSYLATVAHVQPSHETVISQLTRVLFFGSDWTRWLYYVTAGFTTAILVIAANTAYVGFPTLASFLAKDDYLPHQMQDLGHRAVFSKGIMLLTTVAGLLIIVFQASTTALIPLYAIGVFLSFTLSQSGMVVYHLREREARWQTSIIINVIGAIMTGAVTLVIAVTKFTTGGWIVLVLMPIMMAYFMWVHERYKVSRRDLKLTSKELTNMSWRSYNRMHNHVIVLVKKVDRRLVRALLYAKGLRSDRLEAVYIDSEGKEAYMREEWERADLGVRLVVVPAEDRNVVGALRTYIRGIKRPTVDHVLTVVIPEYAAPHVFEATLHSQASFWIKQELFDEPGVIFTVVPYHQGDLGAEAAESEDTYEDVDVPFSPTGSFPAVVAAEPEPKPE